MADTIREKIIAAFVAKAQPLSVAEITRCVRWHDDEPIRNVSIWDGEEIKLDSEYKIQRMTFPIAIETQWQLAAGQNASSSSANVIGEVIQLMMSDITLNGLAETLEYFSSTPTYPDDGSGMVALVVLFNIIYTTKLGDPFSSVY